MTYKEIDDRLKEIRVATMRLNHENEMLEAKIEHLKQERDRLKAELTTGWAEHPNKIET